MQGKGKFRWKGGSMWILSCILNTMRKMMFSSLRSSTDWKVSPISGTNRNSATCKSKTISSKRTNPQVKSNNFMLWKLPPISKKPSVKTMPIWSKLFTSTWDSKENRESEGVTSMRRCEWLKLEPLLSTLGGNWRGVCQRTMRRGWLSWI